MRSFSTRTVTLLTNLALSLILFAVGTVCFLPSVSQTSKLSDRVYYRGNSADGVSLMFNVYWGTQEVEEILSILEEHGARATFFIGGSWADDNVRTVRKIVAYGHELGSHGYFHKKHDTLSYTQNAEEIKTSLDFLFRVTGVKIALFAPPSGAYNEHTVNAAEALGCKTVMWSKDTIDWRDQDEEVCFRRATQGVSGGDLILMHPMAHTVRALPRILKYYQENGLRTVTVGENLAAQGENHII